MEKQLDGLSTNLSYRFVADIRRLHGLFHSASEIDESVPYSITSADDLKSLMEKLRPTKLRQALDLEDEISERALTINPISAISVLGLLLSVHSGHYPVEKIKHKI